MTPFDDNAKAPGDGATGRQDPPPDPVQDRAPPAGPERPDAEPDPASDGPGAAGWLPFRGGRTPRPAPGAAKARLSAAEVQAMRKRALGAKQADGDIAEELSAVLALAERIQVRNSDVTDAADRLGFVLDCVLAESPKLVLARDARLRMQVELYQKSGRIARTLAAVSAGSSVALVLAALVASLVVWSLAFTVLQGLYAHLREIPAFSWLLFMDQHALSVMMFAALVGGAVSIGTRLREFSRVRDLDPFAMFWTAMLKPLIGVILAVVALAALCGGVIGFDGLNINQATLNSDKDLPVQTSYALWLIGFLTGFSERFAWDFVDRAQGGVGGVAPVAPAAPAAGAAK